MMKIGFDAKRIVRNRTGLGNYGRTLVSDLSALMPADELLLYAPDKGNDDLRQGMETLANVQMVYPEGKPLRWQRDLWRMRGIVSDFRRDGINIFHGLSGELPRGIRQSGIRSIVTIHDLIFMRHPEYYNWLDTKIYTYKFRQTCLEADHIIAISECTKRDIMELGGVEEDRISVIYQSCAPRFDGNSPESRQQEVSSHYCLPQRFVLNVGSIEERKNMLLAVKALLRLPEEVGLVIVGRKTPYTKRIETFVNQHGLQQRVRLLHGVADDDLAVLYALAEAFVYPSRYEGFGIPIIEAVNSGLPVVACTGSCLEEAGGPDCLYVSPDDDEALAAALMQTLKGAEGREQRIMHSRQYVQRFAGNNVAKQVMEVYRQVNPLPFS